MIQEYVVPERLFSLITLSSSLNMKSSSCHSVTYFLHISIFISDNSTPTVSVTCYASVRVFVDPGYVLPMYTRSLLV